MRSLERGKHRHIYLRPVAPALVVEDAQHSSDMVVAIVHNQIVTRPTKLLAGLVDRSVPSFVADAGVVQSQVLQRIAEC